MELNLFNDTWVCVVISKLKGIYLLRHIIYDIAENEDIDSVKEKYYKDYCKTETDEFHICKNKTELNQTLKRYNVG